MRLKNIVLGKLLPPVSKFPDINSEVFFEIKEGTCGTFIPTINVCSVTYFIFMDGDAGSFLQSKKVEYKRKEDAIGAMWVYLYVHKLKPANKRKNHATQ